MTQSERISNIDNQSMAYEWHLYPILFLLTLSLLLYKTLIYPIYLSPLSRLPRPHPLCRISPAWILWNRYKSRANRTIHDAHQQLGPIVQLGPNEVSINSMHGGVQVVYAGNFEKHQWYPNVFNNFGYATTSAVCGEG